MSNTRPKKRTHFSKKYVRQAPKQKDSKIVLYAVIASFLIMISLGLTAYFISQSNNSNLSKITPGARPDLEKQINDLQSRFQQNPNDLQVMLSLAHLYLDSKQEDKALELYNKALQLNPQNVEAITHIGNIEESRQNVTVALEKYDQALKIQPGYVHALWDKGLLLSKLGKKNESILVFERFLKIMPSGADADRVKGWINEMKSQPGLVKP